MKWKTCAYEGWHNAFAWFPTPLTTGQTIWLEPYRFYVNSHGAITTLMAAE